MEISFDKNNIINLIEHILDGKTNNLQRKEYENILFKNAIDNPSNFIVNLINICE